MLMVGIPVVLALAWLAARMNGRAAHRSVLDERQLAMRALAQAVVPGTGAKAVLMIGNPFAVKAGANSDLQRYNQAAFDGFRDGAGAEVEVVMDYPELKPEAAADPAAVRIPPTTTPLSFLLADDAFQKLADRHPRAQLIVSVVGIPSGLEKLRLWQSAKEPRLAFLLPDWRVLGKAEDIRAAFGSGKIAGAVLRAPGAPPESQPVKGDPKAELASRFVIVTPDNAGEMTRRHPGIF